MKDIVYAVVIRHGTSCDDTVVFKQEKDAVAHLKAAYKESLAEATEDMTKSEVRIFKEDECIAKKDYFEIRGNGDYHEGWINACAVN